MEELEGNTWYASEMYGKEVTRPILGLGYDVLGRKSDIFFTIILIMLQFSITKYVWQDCEQLNCEILEKQRELFAFKNQDQWP